MSDAPSKSATAVDQVLPLLTGMQHVALNALSTGQTIQAAATTAGCHRNTLMRWIKTDPVFRAAYNIWRQEMVESTRSRVLHMAADAATAVSKAIARGDARISLAILKDLGLTRQVSPGATDPAIEREKLKNAQDAAKNRLVKQRDRFGFSSDRDQLEARLAEAKFLPGGQPMQGSGAKL